MRPLLKKAVYELNSKEFHKLNDKSHLDSYHKLLGSSLAKPYSWPWMASICIGTIRNLGGHYKTDPF